MEVAARTFQPVVRLNRDRAEREIVLMRWGLIPFWAKAVFIGLRTINAKDETIKTHLPSGRRLSTVGCMVPPADAFSNGKSSRQRQRSHSL